jgi:alkylhydroperoxidase/carboxymuconolactone decarboxylase family protein YurZ
MATSKALPKNVDEFRTRYPKIWETFNTLGDLCHDAGPLDLKTRCLVKLALSMGAGLQGATHSAVRKGRAAGVSVNEMHHVALLAITTLGFPSAMRALAWIGDSEGGSDR